MRAVAQRLPSERLIYLGDTARLPYGTKSPETVTRYAVQAARQLRRHDVKAIVIACNTASAAGLPALEAALSPVPVLGVVSPGASAAVRATASGHIGVIATEGTVRGGAYVRAIQALMPNARVSQLACALFVALAEEGWHDNAIARDAAAEYLSPLFRQAEHPDTLVLGCTHFPALKGVIGKACGADVTLVDSAETTAAALEGILEQRGLFSGRTDQADAPVFLATDAPERFARVGSLFLNAPIDPTSVELVDLNQ